MSGLLPPGIADLAKGATQYGGTLGIPFPQRGGTIEIGNGGVLQVDGNLAPDVVIKFNGTSAGQLLLGGVTPATVGAAGTFVIPADIDTFVQGDSIGFPNLPAALIEAVSYDVTAGTIDLSVASRARCPQRCERDPVRPGRPQHRDECRPKWPVPCRAPCPRIERERRPRRQH